MAKKPTKEELPSNVNEVLTQELETHKLTSLVKLCDQLSDMSVTCVPTGLPQLDVILHPHKKGFPLGRDIEIFSRTPEVGKTSLAMTMISAAQHVGMRTAAADVEKTMTDELFAIHRIVTDPFYDPHICALRMMRNENYAISAEEFLGHVKQLSSLFDVLVVDSVAALETRANLDKDVDDAKGVGGSSKLLSEFMRGNLSKRAAIIWINQMRMKVGAAQPGMPQQYVTPGGMAIPFYSSIRIELSMVEKLKMGDDDPPFGMKIKANVVKNKIAPPFRQALLTYLFGKGFSSEYDYFELAVKLGSIEKAGSWFNFKDSRFQGKLNFITAMEENQLLFKDIKAIVDGEDAARAAVDELPPEAPPADVVAAEAA